MLLCRTGQQNIVKELEVRRRLCWFGHVKATKKTVRISEYWNECQIRVNFTQMFKRPVKNQNNGVRWKRIR